MTPASAIANMSPQPTSALKGGAKPAALASDFDTFLKMLTAQARYQDPLEPIDSAEYAAQLAQFSMVEQQVQTNDTLAALVSQMGVSNMASMAGWVGMEARAKTPVTFDGTPVSIAPNPTALADKAFLVVSDSTGANVQRIEIPVSPEPFQWAGVDDDGTPLANGIYDFTIESTKGDEVILSEPAEIYGRITEAQLRNGNVVLVLDGGQSILSSSVTGLREAG